MKKKEILFLINSGVQSVTNHDLTATEAYKVVKFRKALNSAFEAIGEDEKAIAKDCDIEDLDAFFKEFNELQLKKDPSKDEKERLNGMAEKNKRFQELEKQILEEDVTLECKTLSYDDWHKLQNENRDKEVLGRKVDVLSGRVEDLLEGILWAAPEE